MGNRRKLSTENGIKRLDSSQAKSEATAEAPAGVIDLRGPGAPPAKSPGIYMAELPVHLLDPPDVLARPVNDGDEYRDLLDSLRQLGQIDPIIVTPNSKRFKIVDGMHRFTAAKEMGWPRLRAQVFEDEHIAVEAIQLHTCMVHKKMTAWEEYLFYTNLCERMKLSFEDVCTFTKRSYEYVSTRMCIGNLTPETQKALELDRISLSVAIQLMRIKDPLWERYFLDQCLINGAGTRVLQGWISKWQMEQLPLTQDQITKSMEPPPPPPQIAEIPCALCGQVSNGRIMVQVMVHHDELQSLAHFIRMGDKNNPALEASAPPEFTPGK